MKNVRVIVGLGNPGGEYENTRHNAGFLCVDRIAASQGRPWVSERKFTAETTVVDFEGSPVLLVKPKTYVNKSGEVLASLVRYYKFSGERFCAVYDDITLDVGRVKLSIGGGTGGHNGIADLVDRTGNDFHRMRIGIGGKPHPEMDLKDWVLGRFSKEEQTGLNQALESAAEGLRLLVSHGVERAMNRVNTKNKAS